MCEVQEIRYVHTLEHPDYPQVLRVGCICAMNMEGDYVGPRQREDRLKRRAMRKVSWPTRYGWRKSKNGNPWIKVGGWRVGVFRRGAGWGFWCRWGEGAPVWSRRNDYTSEREAKLALFDQLEELRG
jgi:hypothetical protein